MRGATGRIATAAAMVAVTMAVTLGVTMSGCGTKSDDSSGRGREVIVTASGMVSAEVGDVVVVTLASNPSTGYTWEIATAPDAGVAEQQGDITYAPDNPDVVLPGSGGAQTVRFAAVAAGSTQIVLIYHRPWETGVAPVDTVTIDLTVG